MHYAFPFLPLEVQTSIKEMLALGVPESAVDLLIERTSKAIEAKTTSAQRQVIEIGESADRRLEQLSQVYEDRLRLALGDTNGMLADIRTAVQGQEAAVNGLRAEFQTFGEDLSGRMGDLEQRMGASEADRRQLHDQNDRLEQKFDRLEGDVRHALARALGADRVAELIDMIERHERILGGAHEAGG